MSRLVKTIKLLSKLVPVGMQNPRETAASLDLVPSVNSGRQFGGAVSPAHDRLPSENYDSGNPLLSYFDAYREGPGIFKWRHYFDLYHRYFASFVGREVHIMEVGIYSGGSLKMWKNYFGPLCRVYGVDIEPDCLTYKDERTEIFIGDQADPSFWAKVKREAPRVDILIDDGGHEPEQQRVTLEEMLPHLSPGGVFVCEDIHDLHGDLNPFGAYVHGLASNLNAAKSAPVTMENAIAFTPSAFQRMVHSIHLYPFVAVIEKRSKPLNELVCQKHGTQWQPFLDPQRTRTA
jgi:hypothetical protein